ncbi:MULTISPECIES: branched-chain amino acid ABC transporter permease [Methylorubrum]|jgi:branched-chain amino acid transport system permease protein|uniref:Branched-chain amino acid ABC transporter, permease protein n=2 Tax=Methylorubrum extorquens TaxID=408 RepID=C5AZR0_METEA|nr:MULTISPECIES: branched-chain amino acid ABC transporter permease [Methylorubrum]ACS41434.1 Branched-chain amino acid ABC transporter, permease protein [Methylorubrum extorquens AM1]EHP92067.1 ABC-type transporter, integral membrane subunit [Methylorubrum extorquens DSM 13060]MCP1540384.1 branched-chain amino acid transport system permease protein [Methylorubrum extorquens]MCP1587079.1 branched-chain amino acid transport system permease protein [Methylorubrum extorquens]BDL40875.1 branched-c
MSFFLETLAGGLLAGVMYALVAIGFVLIYKASGVFNFAQGAMVLCAALTFVTLTERDVPFWLAGLITLAIMVTLAVAVERIVLRPLVNRSQITLFMATLGLSYIIEGGSQFVMGASVHELDLGISDLPVAIGPIQLSSFDLVAAASAGALVIALWLFFERTRVGVSLRAVADDPQAALSIGIRLPLLWATVWAVAGFVALVAGLLWGARQGVQFSLTFVVLKALPVLIIGGFTSITGAVVGGLIVGAADALAEIYLGPLLGGSVSTWFAYGLAVAFLLVRPAGLFGERAIERV